MQMEDPPAPNEQLVLELSVITDVEEQSWSNRFSWESAPHECSPIWLLRLPPWRNAETRPEPSRNGVFTLTLHVLQAHSLLFHTFKSEDPSAAIKEMFNEDKILPSAVLIWIRRGKLNVITRWKTSAHLTQK